MLVEPFDQRDIVCCRKTLRKGGGLGNRNVRFSRGSFVPEHAPEHARDVVEVAARRRSPHASESLHRRHWEEPYHPPLQHSPTSAQLTISTGC